MATVEELAAQIAVLREQIPTLEDLLFSVGIQTWDGGPSVAEGTRFTLMAAPFPLRVLSVAVSFEYFSLAASDTVYWKGVLEKGTGPEGFPDIAARTTRPTGADANGPITARVPWTWDAAAWSDADLAKGQLLTVNWTPVGRPAALRLPALYTVRYRPL
ncbi:hypothetical protein [Actinocorallia longicatena]|uniref:Uncharacterized protein n=1 Tax=Actinocorallia longicatena TaxID=111803 RepID=A0ABP6QGF8_9ACTN